MTDFTQLWSNAPDGVLEYEGRRLRRVWQLPVATGDRLHFMFEHSVARPVQGLGISLEDRRGSVQIGDVCGRKFALWTDTAPRYVECLIRKAKKGALVSLRNQWRDYARAPPGLHRALQRLKSVPPSA